MVLFWLDLWQIFFLATLGFEPGTSGSLVLHSTTVPQGLQVFTSDNSRYLSLVQREWWCYCTDWTCERFSFLPHQGLNLGPLDLLSCTLPLWPQGLSGFHLWQFQLFNSGGEGLVVVLFWLDLWQIFFLATPGFEPRTSGSLVLHSTNVPPWWLLGFHLWQFQLFNSGAEGLVVVLFWLDLWRFSFWPHLGLNMGPLDLLSCTLPLCHTDFWFSTLTISGI